MNPIKNKSNPTTKSSLDIFKKSNTPKIDDKNIIIDTAIHFRPLAKRFIFSNITLVCATFTTILLEDKTEKIANTVVEKPTNIEDTTNRLNCKLSDSKCFKKIRYPLSIPVYHSKYPNSIPLFTAASIDTKKYLAIFSVFTILPFICSSNLFL